MPAGQTLAHLRRRFNPIASLLLSAESLSDMSDRKDLCKAVTLWPERPLNRFGRYRIYGMARDYVRSRQSRWSHGPGKLTAFVSISKWQCSQASFSRSCEQALSPIRPKLPLRRVIRLVERRSCTSTKPGIPIGQADVFFNTASSKPTLDLANCSSES